MSRGQDSGASTGQSDDWRGKITALWPLELTAATTRSTRSAGGGMFFVLENSWCRSGAHIVHTTPTYPP